MNENHCPKKVYVYIFIYLYIYICDSSWESMGITYKDEVKSVLGVIWAEKNSKMKKNWKISILSIDLSIFMSIFEHFWP